MFNEIKISTSFPYRKFFLENVRKKFSIGSKYNIDIERINDRLKKNKKIKNTLKNSLENFVRSVIPDNDVSSKQKKI